MNCDDGSPAFPHDAPVNGYRCPGPGMSMRDYLAAHADVPWTEVAITFIKKKGRDATVSELADYVAEIRYVMADAMLQARKS